MPTNPYGEIYSDTNKVSGTSGNDKIVVSSGEGTDYVFGGNGNDTFMVKAHEILNQDLSTVIDIQIHDFQGAGGYDPFNNDFLHFSGFGAGSTFTLETSRGVNGVAGDNGAAGTMYYYTLHDTTTGFDVLFLVKSMNDALLSGKHDYAFY